MYELIGKQLGKYQIISLIGRGGMAELYKAYQPNMERYVALKILHTYIAEDPDSLERFKQEAKHIARLRHENILPVYDFGEDEGFPYLVMPFVENKSLADAMRGKRLSISQVCKIVFDIASALYYAHQHGIVHLDVKPSNILIDQQGHCDLIDFGLARIFQETPGNFFASSIMGTPAYMSPEQARGDQTDHRSDIYSLGIVLYEMATGRVPYEAETVAALLYMHIRGALPPPRVVNPALPE